MRQFVRYRIVSFSRPFQSKRRWALNFDGVGVRGQLANRIINPDGDNSFEFWSPDIQNSTSGTIISQNISNVISDREFQLFDNTNGTLALVYGGQSTDLCSRAQGYEPNKKYWLEFTGNSFALSKGVKANIIKSGSFLRGVAREVNALTVIGARTAGSIGNYTIFSKGIQRDVRINGKLYPMRDYNQAIQLPMPTGLGDELITQSVLENPVEVGNQWSYLGSGRWSYVGDGSLNTLKFILTANQPAQGFFEFEIESISGGGITCTDTVPSNSVFTTIGVKRFFYTNKADITSIAFKRAPAGTPVSCIVKNISFKPLGACNPMTISNATSTNWMQVVDDYDSKFRKVLNFDGVGIRGVLANRAINLDGDIDIEFYTPAVVGAVTERVIISQQISTTNANQEFRLYISGSTGNLIVNLGGTFTGIANNGQFQANQRLRLLISGGSRWLYRTDGTIISSGAAPVGAAREPTAQTVLGARTSGTIGTYSQHVDGIQRDIKINGTLWPIADRNQSIQLPEPSGLGAELLVNPTASENGASWGKTNITVQSLSSNSFRLTNTQASYAGAIFQTIPTTIGDKYVIRFKVGFQTANTNFRVSINSTAAAIYTGDLLAANYTVSEQYLFVVFTATTTSATVRLLCNSSNAGSYVDVSELTVKPLGNCNPMTISNATSANWEDLEI